VPTARDRRSLVHSVHRKIFVSFAFVVARVDIAEAVGLCFLRILLRMTVRVACCV